MMRAREGRREGEREGEGSSKSSQSVTAMHPESWAEEVRKRQDPHYQQVVEICIEDTVILLASLPSITHTK